MELEKEIKQSLLKSPASKAVLNIIYTGSWLMGKTVQVLKPYGISAQQYNVLRILKGRTPDSTALSDIQERMLDRMSNATRLVEKLRQKQYVTRVECPGNRRKVDIHITTTGLSLLADIYDKIDESENEMMKKLSETQIESLNEILDQLR